MIFKQFDEILQGRKTQTRRVCKPDHNWLTPSPEDRTTVLKVWNETLDDYVPTHGRTIYAVGHTYAVVPKRGMPAVWWRSESDRNCYRAAGYQQMRIRITAIRREPLQSITEADARAEGIENVDAYRALWESINGRTPGARWADNPDVWVITFELVR